ncbi:hypothetical protein H7U19_12885 [Hyunsoonleella sp. SJ7]|uniref:DUF4926 domain-containing protein n=1 Tax=Hyunsoonleella aquatilis TaxID=2762758 RepID=A0A923KGY3_9FLAO|nr:hypothetical protein [Hyunsoonleella aquatilis]MBC3759306.1 hypothetical protein [Hyunsoonleella aquatilis]
MIVLEILGRIFIEFLFEGIILGIYRLLKKFFELIKIRLFGFEKKTLHRKKILEQKLLYKEIELLENVNPNLKYGQKGVILEIIDKENVFAEFLDANGKQIEFENKIVFSIKMNQFKLKK